MAHAGEIKRNVEAAIVPLSEDPNPATVSTLLSWAPARAQLDSLNQNTIVSLRYDQRLIAEAAEETKRVAAANKVVREKLAGLQEMLDGLESDNSDIEQAYEAAINADIASGNVTGYLSIKYHGNSIRRYGGCASGVFRAPQHVL